MQDDALDVQQDALRPGDLELTDRTSWAVRPMADWREKGYVPDSDDEDEIDLRGGPCAINSPKNPTACTLALEAKPSVTSNEVKRDAESKSPAESITAGRRNAAALQEVRNNLAEKTKPEAGEEWSKSYASGSVAVGESKQENWTRSSCQLELITTVEPDEALPAASVADQLQAELEHGLRSVRDILGDTNLRSRSPSIARSQTSSPLSSIQSFIEDGETAASQSRREAVQADQGNTEGPTSRDHQIYSPPRYPGRDLRRRNPIQLHPYALEDARYQQELKAHGIKPVRTAFGGSGMPQDRTTDDSQDQDLFSSSQMSDSAQANSSTNLDINLHSPIVPSSRVGWTTPSRLAALFDDDDDELPEFSAILQGEVPHLHVRKRRKVAHKSPKEASRSLAPNDFHVPELPLANPDSPIQEDMDVDTLKIPLSPPRSSSSNMSGTLMVPSKTFGSGKRMTPRGLPTPAASSLTKAPLESRSEKVDSPDSSEDSELDDSSISGSAPLTAEIRRRKGILSMRRRIKGVLPASWLTLDLDKQRTKAGPGRPSAVSPVKQPNGKGIAQKLKSSRRQFSFAEEGAVPLIDLSDDSSETSNPPLTKASSAWASTLFEDDNFGGTILDDVVEDNSFDTMAQLLPRSGKRAQMHSGRQRTLHEPDSTNGGSRPSYSSMPQTSHKRKKQSMPMGNVQPHQKHKHKKSAPISQHRRILNDPVFAELRLGDQPQFLRIAARRARTRWDKRYAAQRQSMSASETDRQNVNLGSLDLSESHVTSQEGKASLPGRKSTQQTLSAYQINSKTSPVTKTSTKANLINNLDELASLKKSTASTVRRLLLRQVGSSAPPLHNSTNPHEPSIAHSATSQRINLPQTLLSHYRNRAGKGCLTSSLAPVRETRPAQLEGTQSRASDARLITLGNPTTTSNSTALTTQILNQAVSRRPGRKRVPQHRDDLQQRSIEAGDCGTAKPGKKESMHLRPGTFFRDLTFAGYDDLVRIIRKVRETGYDSTDYVELVQSLRTYYGNNNMDEPFAEKSSDTREFLECHRAGRAIQLPTSNDMGFDAFLKLVIITGLQKASSGEKTSSLSNFIFSLIPNSGQLLRKDQDLDSWALKPLQNRHDLYSALYFIAPLQTKIHLLPQIQSLVDLRKSHMSACNISLRTLVRLARFQISTDEPPYVLYSFGKLFQKMIKKTEEQFDAARLEALTPIGGTLSRRDSLGRIVRFNQNKIQGFLTSILRAWSDCIRNCRTADQARPLLIGDDFGAVLGLCNRTIVFNRANNCTDGCDDCDTVAFRDEVIEAIWLAVSSYILNWLTVADRSKDYVDELHFPLKSVLSTHFGRHEQCSDKILRSLTYTWQALAKISVHYEVRSWDNYLSLGGRDAWQSFDDTWHKRQYEIYFAARFIEFNPNVWREWQIPMLDLWIRSLLVPEAYFKYQADLTAQVLRHDGSWNPLFFHLPLVTYRDTYMIHVELDDLISARTALVLALVRNMNSATTRPDSQDSFFGAIGPNEDDYSAMLKNMMTVMKQYLKELEGESVAQKIYGDFVGVVLAKMRVCTTHLEPVPDDFEYMPGKCLPMPPGAVKAKLELYRQQMIECGMEKHMIVFLHTAAERAAITGQQEAFEKQLVDVFLDLTPVSLEDAQGYAPDARFRTLFFQNVFPAYLDRIFCDSGLTVSQPVLGCIDRVYKGLRFRFGLWTLEYLQPFLTATLSLLSTLKTTFTGSITLSERILTDASQLRAYTLLSSIMCEVLSRCQEIEDSFGPSGTLSALWEYFLFFYQWTLKVAFRPPRALPQVLRDEDDDTVLSEPKLSSTDDNLLAYSRHELGDMLDSKWVRRYDGTWFVNRAGGRREQVHAGNVVGSLEQETSRMQAAAERYVEVFAALWNAH
jgi:hypothetical protein